MVCSASRSNIGRTSRCSAALVVFEGPTDLDEPAFESLLWDRIKSLSDKDVWRGQDYDDRVSADPANPHFSLSFGGEAFFIVGLPPQASRPRSEARRVGQWGGSTVRCRGVPYH